MTVSFYSRGMLEDLGLGCGDKVYSSCKAHYMQILRSRPCIASSLLKTQTLRQGLMPSGNDGFKGSLCIQCWPMVRKCQLSAVQIDFKSCLSYLYPSTFELISDRSGFVALS